MLECIIASWPLQALAYISKLNFTVKIRTNDTFWPVVQGIDLHSPLQCIPASVLSEIGVMVFPEDINPDVDMQPTGSNQLVISDGNAHSYDFSGHYAGTITLQRLHYIRLDHALTGGAPPGDCNRHHTRTITGSNSAREGIPIGRDPCTPGHQGHPQTTRTKPDAPSNWKTW